MGGGDKARACVYCVLYIVLYCLYLPAGHELYSTVEHCVSMCKVAASL